MPVVAAIRPKGRSRARFLVEFADGRAAVELAAEVVAVECLAAGREVDEARIAALLLDDERSRCRDRAWALIARRQRSRSELRTELLRRKFAAAVVEEVVARIEELGHLDDAAFARDVVEREAHARRHGPLIVRRKLASRGVAADIVDEAIAPVANDEAQRASARAILEKWNRRREPSDPRKRREAAAGHLMRRGFEPDVVWETVREVMGRNAESE